MASNEWPNATNMTTRERCAQNVPYSQPSESRVRCRFAGTGAGGSVALPRNSSVSGHQISRITTITVVICMIRNALLLDSGTPLMLPHQKYTVTATLKNTENKLGS